MTKEAKTRIKGGIELYDEVELKDEVEMQTLISKQLPQIEKGLALINQKVKIGGEKEIDILALDSDEILTIIELKVDSDENQLIQALGYFDWAFQNIDWMKNAYSVKIADNTPRIILIAKEFSQKILLLAKYLKEQIDIKLFTYKTYLIENKKVVFFSDFPISSAPEIIEKPKEINEHLEYIKEPKIKTLAKNTIEKIEQLDKEHITTNSKKWGIVFKYDGRNFAELYPKREAFELKWKEEPEWAVERQIKKPDRVAEIIQQNIILAIELAKKKKGR